MASDDQGGEAACWAHLDRASQPVIVDLAVITEVGGAVWSLRESAGDDVDLDVNLIRLASGASIGSHVNRELDVVVVVQSGSLMLTIDGVVSELDAGSIGFVPKGADRAIAAGHDGVGYLSIHRRRQPMQPFRR